MRVFKPTRRGQCVSPDRNVWAWVIWAAIEPLPPSPPHKKGEIKLDPPVSAVWAFPLLCESTIPQPNTPHQCTHAHTHTYTLTLLEFMVIPILFSFFTPGVIVFALSTAPTHMATFKSLTFWSSVWIETSMLHYTLKVNFMHNYLLLSSLCVVLSSPSPLSHQSVSPPFPNPPPSLPSVLDDLLSHSLTFSLRLIPLTMHVPKTDLIFIRGVNPAPPPPHPPPNPTPLNHHSQALPPFQIQVMFLPKPAFQLHHLETPPCTPCPNNTHTHTWMTPHPSIFSHIGIWRRVSLECPPIRGSLLV